MQGNRLVGPLVLDAVAEAFHYSEQRPLVERLIEILATGMANLPQ